MSSAILYVAIVAIWAGVLIPRLIRRDSSPSSSEEQDDDDLTDTAAADKEPAPAPHRREDHEAAAEEQGPAPEECHEVPYDPAHRRVLSARRRLLGLLVVLTIGSFVLAVMRLAAWWVVILPSVMLLGYLILLRAAAKSDTERREPGRARAAVTGDSGAPAGAVTPATPPRAEVIHIAAPRGPGVRAGEGFHHRHGDGELRAVGD